LLPALKGVKILITNKEDLAVLFPGHRDTGALVRERLLGQGIEVVAVKKGEEGSELYTKDGRVIVERAVNVPIVEDVIGAGDAYDAALLGSLYRGLDPSKAVRYASIAGAQVVTVRGDIEAQPSWRELEVLEGYLRERMDYIR